MSDQARALYIDVYSDVICPWCYVGKRRLERALNEWNGSVPVKISWKPFQLNPAMPKSGMDRRQYLDAKFGGTEPAQSIYDHVAAAGAVERIPFAFDRIARTPNTFAAHRLIWVAGHQGKQDEMVEMLFRRYFVEGRDIGNVETLAQAAADVGLDRTAIEAFLPGDEGGNELQAEEAAGRRLGIRAVPCFVINGTSVLSGAQPPEEFLAAFKEIEVGSVVGKAGA